MFERSSTKQARFFLLTQTMSNDKDSRAQSGAAAEQAAGNATSKPSWASDKSQDQTAARVDERWSDYLWQKGGGVLGMKELRRAHEAVKGAATPELETAALYAENRQLKIWVMHIHARIINICDMLKHEAAEAKDARDKALADKAWALRLLDEANEKLQRLTDDGGAADGAEDIAARLKAAEEETATARRDAERYKGLYQDINECYKSTYDAMKKYRDENESLRAELQRLTDSGAGAADGADTAATGQVTQILTKEKRPDILMQIGQLAKQAAALRLIIEGEVYCDGMTRNAAVSALHYQRAAEQIEDVVNETRDLMNEYDEALLDLVDHFNKAFVISPRERESLIGEIEQARDTLLDLSMKNVNIYTNTEDAEEAARHVDAITRVMAVLQAVDNHII